MPNVFVTVIEEIPSSEVEFTHNVGRNKKFSPGCKLEVLSEGDDYVLVPTSEDPKDNVRIPKRKVQWPEL